MYVLSFASRYKKKAEEGKNGKLGKSYDNWGSKMLADNSFCNCRRIPGIGTKLFALILIDVNGNGDYKAAATV